MSEREWLPVLKVWCGRRDEAHRNKKGELRRTLVKIVPVETGKPTLTGVKKDTRVPFPCKRITHSRKALTHWDYPALTRMFPQQAQFDWEKGRRLWKREYEVKETLAPFKTMEALEKVSPYGGLDPETSRKLFDEALTAARSSLNANSTELFPGHLRVTCPVCGTIYRLTLYGEVAEWLDKQLGKTRYVSAKHLEKLSLEMMAKLRQAGLLQQDEP